jgi:hypothetical protein
MMDTALLALTLVVGTQNASPTDRLENVFSAATLERTAEPDITGVYLCEGENNDGTRYRGEVIIRKKQDSYLILWRFGTKQRGVGVAVRKGRTLAVSAVTQAGEAAGVGVVLYDIQAGPKLVGHFTDLGGDGTLRSETLTFVKRIE